MRADLKDAYESVYWAVAQVKVLQGRIDGWRRNRPYLPMTEPDSEPGKEIIKVKVNSPLPLLVNAEAGAILHMIRSGLDILAVTLAERNGHIRPEDVYFPVAKSHAEFIDPKGSAQKKVARLSKDDRLVIEGLKPYDGGDAVLFSLHRLDILRKHQRLVGVTVHARNVTMTRAGTGQPPEFILNGDLEDGTPLARVPAGANYHVHIAPEVTFNETPFAKRRPVLETLRTFAGRAIGIIKLFDS